MSDESRWRTVAHPFLHTGSALDLNLLRLHPCLFRNGNLEHGIVHDDFDGVRINARHIGGDGDMDALMPRAQGCASAATWAAIRSKERLLNSF